MNVGERYKENSDLAGHKIFLPNTLFHLKLVKDNLNQNY